MYNYIKALHVIFIVTWFAGMFYMPRLFIYNTEAQENINEEARNALTAQFTVMMKRLWYGITVPSAVLTLIFGSLLVHLGKWYLSLFNEQGSWLLVKLCFVILLYVYFFSLQKILKQQTRGIFKYTSQQLRLWNEVATVFLFAIVFLAVVKTAFSLLYGLGGLMILVIVLLVAIKIYQKLRERK